MDETKQSEIIKAALQNVRSMVDANTVTGTPIRKELYEGNADRAFQHDL